MENSATAAPTGKATAASKLKQRRTLMQQVRTNTCSMETLQNMEHVDPKLQTQVLQQVKLQKKSTAGGGKSRSRKKASGRTSGKTSGASGQEEKKTTGASGQENEPVSQSTADTNASIHQAKYQIFMTALEKEIQSLNLDETLHAEAQNGLSVVKKMMETPEFHTKISGQLLKWSQQKSIPSGESITAFIRDLLDLYKKQSSPQYRFNHDAPVETTTATETSTS